MTGERIDLHERPFVEKILDAFTRRLLALGVYFLYAGLAHGEACFRDPVPKIRKLAGRRCEVRLLVGGFN